MSSGRNPEGYEHILLLFQYIGLNSFFLGEVEYVVLCCFVLCSLLFLGKVILKTFCAYTGYPCKRKARERERKKKIQLE